MSVASRHVEPGGFVGSRRDPSDIRAFMVHMAEGVNVSDYLSKAAAVRRGKPGHPEPPARNVSVQYTIEHDGEIVDMVPESRVAGSLDPHAIRTTTQGYYGADHARYVLGDLWRNPNVGCIAVEVAGTAKVGPNDRQVDALVRLFKDCRTRYPHIKPLGHRDLQNVKPCPGSTDAIKAAFTGMGGHGKDYRRVPKPPPTDPPVIPPPVPHIDLVAQAVLLEQVAAQLRAAAEQEAGDGP